MLNVLKIFDIYIFKKKNSLAYISLKYLINFSTHILTMHK